MSQVAGFYGKLPVFGDFINRRLSTNFVEKWDHWLQSALSQSQIMLGDQWLNLYLTSPIWRFVIAKGQCGERPWFGVMMPSVDSVGRYFPLTIACPLPLDANLLQVVINGHQWFQNAEQVIVEALQNQQFNIEDFDAKVVALGNLSGQLSLASSTDQGFGSQWQIPLVGSSAQNAIMQLSHQMVLQRLSDYTLWWGSGSEHVVPSILISAGMPQPQSFCSMLDGQWQTGGWEQWR